MAQAPKPAPATPPQAAARKRGEQEVDQRGAISLADLGKLVDTTDPDVMPADVLVCDLDADGVYWGHIIKASATLAPADVLVHDKIDLPAGRYKWNGESFEPLKREATKPLASVPSLDQAFDALLASIASAGTPLPTKCREWQAWFKTTIDNKG